MPTKKLQIIDDLSGRQVKDAVDFLDKFPNPNTPINVQVQMAVASVMGEEIVDIDSPKDSTEAFIRRAERESEIGHGRITRLFGAK